MSDADLHIKWWQLDAGLRFLRMVSPEHAEYEYAFTKDYERLLQGLVSEGRLGTNGAHNVIRREVTGRKRNITHFPDGSSRSWTGDIPDDFKDLPTIEPQPPEASSLHAATTFLSDLAPSLPKEIAEEAREKLSKINDGRAPIGLPSDLSFLTTKSQSFEDARLRAQRAVVIMEFLDRVAPSGDRRDADEEAVEAFATQCRNAYSNATLNGTLYAPLLLLVHIVTAAKPAWPFGAGTARFVCGQIPCNHRICNENIRTVQAGSLRMAARDIHAYVLANEAGLTNILSSASATRIEQAASMLLSRGKTERQKLAHSRTVPDFYTLHFRFMPFFKAAQLGFEFLASGASAGTETRARYESLMNEADEGGARSAGALVFDFLNSIDFTPLLRLRATYGSIAEQSNIAANVFLQKWIHDETLIPPFWSDYVSGKSEGVPLALQ